MTTVRIAVYVDPPYSFDCFENYPSSKCLSPGYELEYIYTVIRGFLKFNVQWIRVNNSKEMENLLTSGQADIGGLSLAMNSSYVKQWGFPPPNYLHDDIAFVAKEIDVGTAKYFGLLSSFKWDLWIAIVLFSLATFSLRWVSKKIRLSADPAPKSLARKSYDKFAYFFRANLCYSLWFLFLSFLLNFYSNLIAVDLVRPNTVKTVAFSSMEDLGEKLVQNKCRLIMVNQYKIGDEFDDYVINPTKSSKAWAPLFLKAYAYNKPLYVENRSDLVDFVKKGDCNIGLDYGTMDTYYLTNYCDLRIVTKPDDLPLLGYTFYTTMEKIKEPMSTVMSSLPFQSFPGYLGQKYLSNPTPPDCRATKMVTEIDVILTMAKVQDCFYILFIGLCLALFVIFFQKCKFEMDRNNYYF